jgi:hypothetical protein
MIMDEMGCWGFNGLDRQTGRRIGLASQWNHDVYDRLEGMVSPPAISVTGEIRSSRVLPLNGSLTVTFCYLRSELIQSGLQELSLWNSTGRSNVIR